MTVKLLAIETATEACSAALSVDGKIIERYEVAPRKHNELILPMCEQLLAEAAISMNQIDVLAFGCGPGAFTGLRIAASVTQGIALAHDLPVASISTLANLANQVAVNIGERVMPAIDARMEEIYWAIYQLNEQDEMQLIGDEKVQLPSELNNLPEINYACGTGWGAYYDVLSKYIKLDDSAIDAQALPRAAITAELGIRKYHNNDVVEAMNALPVYLRNQVVQSSAKI